MIATFIKLCYNWKHIYLNIKSEYSFNKANSTTQKSHLWGTGPPASSQYRPRGGPEHSLPWRSSWCWVAGVVPSTTLARTDRQGTEFCIRHFFIFLIGCIMLININQNKKNSGKRISCNKGNKMITKHSTGSKKHQAFREYNNTKKKRRTWSPFFRT